MSRAAASKENGGGMSSPFDARPSAAGGAAARTSCAGWRRRPAAGAAEAEVEPARMQRVEQAELLDHRQRGPVAELHGAGADPDRARWPPATSAMHDRRARCRPRRG